VRQAVEMLYTADVVLGPSDDGGYYLIGMKRLYPELFKDIAWSTDQVTSQTLARSKKQDLQVALLPSWYDVDTIEDLRRLRAELETLPPNTLLHTRRFFKDQFVPTDLE
jgi:glycosyltransferase A (GT-A) superfamily protein (DUF2064 family)